MKNSSFFDEELEKIKAQGLERRLRSIASAQGPEITIDGRKVVNFCSNDYLGLAADPRLIAALRAALDKYGAGSGSARLVSGNFDLMEEFEREIARWAGVEAALLFNSGYHANIGVIPALAGEDSEIFSDELNHASLVDGCRLSKAKVTVYRHQDANELESKLKTSTAARKLIVTEAIFSMEGDVCHLPPLMTLAQKYDAWIYLDQAHAIGVYGVVGQGLEVHLRAVSSNPLLSDVDLSSRADDRVIFMGTLGKALGSYGAFVCGPKSVRDYLMNKARTFLFATALPPSVIAAGREALKIMYVDFERRERLAKNIKRFSSLMGMPPGMSPIFPIRIGPAEKAVEASQALLDAGLYVQAIRPPTVPDGTSRLRVTLTSEHTEAQMVRLKEALRPWI